MKNKKLRYVLTSVLFLSLAILSYFSWGYMARNQLVKARPVIVERLPKIKYDTAILSRFESLSKHLDPNREEYFVNGRLLFKDGKDSSSHIQELDYEFRKIKDDYYCKMGANEILNTQGYNISIDHLNKQILVSEQKKMVEVHLFPSTKELVSNMEKERYELSEISTNEVKKIQLLNNYHITCKEYTITYDKENLKPKMLFVRFTNFEDPESVEKEKRVTFFINVCEDDAKWEEIVGKSFANNSSGEWKPINKYKNYKLYVL